MTCLKLKPRAYLKLNKIIKYMALSSYCFDLERSYFESIFFKFKHVL